MVTLAMMFWRNRSCITARWVPLCAPSWEVRLPNRGEPKNPEEKEGGRSSNSLAAPTRPMILRLCLLAFAARSAQATFHFTDAPFDRCATSHGLSLDDSLYIFVPSEDSTKM